MRHPFRRCTGDAPPFSCLPAFFIKYFASAESFKPDRKKTALLLHAKDDLPEVRVKVFDLLRSLGSSIRFRAVVCDKDAIRIREEKKRQASPGYRYNPDHLYDELARSLLGKRHAQRHCAKVALLRR
jgi:hypothetical protein